MRNFTLSLLLVSIFSTFSVAQDGPKRYPPMVQKLSESLAQLDLSGEQKTKVDAILKEAADKITRLRAQADGNMESFRNDAGQVFGEVRSKLQDVLTPEQVKKLQESMPKRFNGGDNPPPPGMDMNEKKSDPQIPAKAPTTVPVEHLKIGEKAPDFKIKRIDGKQYSLASFRGSPTVIVFGSFSSPTFRSRVVSFEELKHDYNGRANVVVVYTREAYPDNEWKVQRNEDDQVKVEQPASIEDRIKLAKQTRDAAKLTLDVLVDDLDDFVATSYDGFPNGCVLLDKDGNVIMKQHWADAWGVRSYLDSTLKAR